MIPPVTICLIGCGKAKAAAPAKAKDLYTGSLFRSARAYAETCDAWWIVSAKHGLLDPEKKIAPYEARLPRGAMANDNWGITVACALLAAMEDIRFQVTILAGREYAEPIRTHLARLHIATKLPLEGMQLGERLSWLKRERDSFDRCLRLQKEPA